MTGFVTAREVTAPLFIDGSGVSQRHDSLEAFHVEITMHHDVEDRPVGELVIKALGRPGTQRFQYSDVGAPPSMCCTRRKLPGLRAFDPPSRLFHPNE